MMAKSFNKLVEKMSQSSKDKIKQRTMELRKEMALNELRQAVELTQKQLADVLKMNQAAISKMEHQSDMYISTLRRFLEAMGANLKIIASFPEGDVVIDQFERLHKKEKMRNQ